MESCDKRTSKARAGVVTLREILDHSAKKDVTDEQVERMLQPVLAMIQAGMFDKSRWHAAENVVVYAGK